MSKFSSPVIPNYFQHRKALRIFLGGHIVDLTVAEDDSLFVVLAVKK